MASNTYEAKVVGGVNLITTVADKSWMIDSFLNNSTYMKPAIVGLDIEWNSNSTNNDRVATLQLCFGTRCLIIQLMHLDQIPSSLKTFMLDESICFVGVGGIREDLTKLERDYGLQCRNWKELGPLLADHGTINEFFCTFRLAHLACNFVGLDMMDPGSVIRSDWSSRYLDGEQIKYAAMDAYASYEIGMMKLLGGGGGAAAAAAAAAGGY